ncbi:MAG: phosphatase PAP2 family protein [Bacteroidales bacterium]|jgi:membrane-associated phospholipid phosphatase|nr:phosphatase PAP2 family protein [Bacteroidales bacterium]
MKTWSLFILIVMLGRISYAQDKSGVEISGDILEYAMPAMALTSTLIWRDDTHSTWQFVKSIGTAVGVAYILKQTVHKERPDFNAYSPRYDSFPSGHTTSAFCSAAFMERRYGWKVGVPAYIIAAYVGGSRDYADRHDWWDVLGGAVIGTSSSYLFTKAYKKENLDLAVNMAPGNCVLGMKFRF